MGALKDTEEAVVLDAVLDGAYYLALYSVAPTDSTAGTEIDGTGYERESLSGHLSESTSGLKVNSDDIVFGPATEAWDDVAGMAVLTAATEGTQKIYCAVSPAVAVANGQTFKVAVGELQFTAD